MRRLTNTDLWWPRLSTTKNIEINKPFEFLFGNLKVENETCDEIKFQFSPHPEIHRNGALLPSGVSDPQSRRQGAGQ